MSKKQVFIGFRIIVSVGLLILLFRNLNISDLFAHFASLKIHFLIIALLFLVFQTLLSTIKWGQILQTESSNPPLLFLWKTILIGSFLSLFLPSNIGGDVYRIYAVRNENHSLGKSTSSVIFDRITGVVALISIAFIASAFLPDQHYSWIIIVGYLLILLGFMFVTSDSAVSWFSRFPFRWARFPLKILKSLNAYQKDRTKMVIILLISFLFHITIVLISKIYTVALGFDVPFWQLMIIIPLISLAEALPVSINGFGVRESAFVFFFSLMGQPREQGLAVSLLAVFMRYVIGAIGGTILLYHTVRIKPKGKQMG